MYCHDMELIIGRNMVYDNLCEYVFCLNSCDKYYMIGRVIAPYKKNNKNNKKKILLNLIDVHIDLGFQNKYNQSNRA